jgi:hypothetical protein
LTNRYSAGKCSAESSSRIFIPAFRKNILRWQQGIILCLSGFAWWKALLDGTPFAERLYRFQKNRTRRKIMKTALIRILTLATLATSMSCFAAADDSKRDAAPNTAAAKQEGCNDSAKHAKKQKQEKKTQGDDQSEKDLDRLLMGIYG